MKTTHQVLIAVLSGLIFTSILIACGNTQGRSQEVDLTQDEQLKQEVFDQILSDRELFNDLMNEMMQHDQSMNWMMDHDQMMQHMYSQDYMNQMMQQNPNMRQPMMQGWMNMMEQDSSMYNQMNEMMQQHHMGGGQMH